MEFKLGKKGKLRANLEVTLYCVKTSNTPGLETHVKTATNDMLRQLKATNDFFTA